MSREVENMVARSLRVWSQMIVLCAGLLFVATAQSADLKPKHAIPLFLKIITYDDSFIGLKRADTVRIYVLFNFADANSYQQLQDAEEFFLEQGPLTVSGVPIKFCSLPLGGADSVLRQASDSSYTALIATTLDDKDIRPLSGTILRHGVHTFSFDVRSLKAGIAVSVRAESQRTSIVVNLAQAKSEGSRFSARLLSMCEIVNDQK